MGILTTQDKEKIKRAIPKANNKIIDATIARLYIAYPDHTQWKYTQLMGAITLVDDLVGHTFFLKLVDVIGNRGVIWDQEIYIEFEYNQDRKFFHTFELEECLAGLLFEDSNDASHFYKRVTARMKHGSKQTVNNKNAVKLKEQHQPPQQKVGPRGEFIDVNTAQRSRRAKGVLYYDDLPPPEWRSLYSELAAAGITEDMIADNREFIKDYISQQGGPLVGLEPPIPRKLLHNVTPTRTETNTSISTGGSRKNKAPPPPPPPPAKDDVPLSHPLPPTGAGPGMRPTPALSTDYPVSGVESGSGSDIDSPAPSPAPTPQSRFRVPPPSALPPHKNGPPPTHPGGFGTPPPPPPGHPGFGDHHLHHLLEVQFHPHPQVEVQFHHHHHVHQ